MVLDFTEWMNQFGPPGILGYSGSKNTVKVLGWTQQGSSHLSAVGIFSERKVSYGTIDASFVSYTPKPTRPARSMPPGSGIATNSPRTRKTASPSSASIALPNQAYWAQRTIYEGGLENCIMQMFSFSSKIIWFQKLVFVVKWWSRSIVSNSLRPHGL